MIMPLRRRSKGTAAWYKSPSLVAAPVHRNPAPSQRKLVGEVGSSAPMTIMRLTRPERIKSSAMEMALEVDEQAAFIWKLGPLALIKLARRLLAWAEIWFIK